jgi:hypothetical protein
MQKLGTWVVTVALALAAGPAFACDPERAAVPADAFDQADADGDGKLSPAEFESLEEVVKQQRVDARFARLDEDGDGQISAEELSLPRLQGKPPCGAHDDPH